MRELSTITADILASKIINPIIKVVKVNYDTLEETIIPGIISIDVSTNDAQFSNNCTVTIKNVNPNDPGDYGYYTPHRNDEAHNKPLNAWYKILVPNARIRIYMGYEPDNLVSIFYGLVDQVESVSNVNDPTLTLTCRDMGKKLMDQNVNCKINDVLNWGITYPLPEGADVFYIAAGVADIDLDGVVYDIFRRAGIEGSLISTETTGVKLSDLEDGEWAFGDDESGSETDETWDSAINKIKNYTMFDCWTNETGRVCFERPLAYSLDDLAYTFSEGINIFSLPLILNHDNVFGRIRVVGDGVSYTADVSEDFRLWDGSYVFPMKLKTVQDEKLQTVEACELLAKRLIGIMREKYTTCQLQCIPLPHLQLHDIIKIVNYGHMNDYYIVKGQTFNYSSGKLTHTIQATHYTHSEVG